MWERIKNYLDMGEYCLKQPWSIAPCRDYWLSGLYVALAAVALLAVLVFVARRWRLNAMRRASIRLTREYLESQQRIADELTMQHVKWKGDNIVAPEQDQAHLTAEIRAALQSRRINGQ